jgi:putative acetyltransferase
MLIRDYRENDIPAIARLYYDTVHQINIRDYNSEQIAAWAPAVHPDAFWRKRFQTRRVYVTEEEDMVVGFAEFEGSSHIGCFYVHHAWQGRRVGSRLIKQIEQEAKVRQSPLLFADVSLTAKLFFQRQGFVIVQEQERRYQGCWFRQFFMQKILTAS